MDALNKVIEKMSSISQRRIRTYLKIIYVRVAYRSFSDAKPHSSRLDTL